MCLNELHNAKSNRSLKPVGFRNDVNTKLSDIARGFNTGYNIITPSMMFPWLKPRAMLEERN